MEIHEFDIPGLLELVPRVFEDERGVFFESYRADQLHKVGIKSHFLQDNQSISKKGVLRGIHFQNDPYAQEKLVRVVKGSILDVAVDLRPDSPTLGKSVLIKLDDQRNNMFYIPKGFGHGFLALEDSILQYKCTEYYQPQSEGGIIWNDPDLNIDWGIKSPIVSAKDSRLQTFRQFLDQE